MHRLIIIILVVAPIGGVFFIGHLISELGWMVIINEIYNIGFLIFSTNSVIILLILMLLLSIGWKQLHLWAEELLLMIPFYTGYRSGIYFVRLVLADLLIGVALYQTMRTQISPLWTGSASLVLMVGIAFGFSVVNDFWWKRYTDYAGSISASRFLGMEGKVINVESPTSGRLLVTMDGLPWVISYRCPNNCNLQEDDTIIVRTIQNNEVLVTS